MAALCVRCRKNQAVLFVSRMENGEMKSEGYCLKCAKELGMKPIDDVLNNLGLKEEDLDAICEQANELLGGELMNVDENNGNIGETGTDNILRRLYGNLFPHAMQRSDMPPRDQAGPTGPNRQPRKNEKVPEKKYLNAFCIDLTAKAKAGQLDGLIGRETELQRTMQILNRRLKNNPCLIGEPGVGKTAIVEGLAQQIVRGNAPYKLLDKEIWQLDMTALVAGTQYRGQMEGRMKGLLDEIKALGNIILFIDEVHSIVGAGDAEGGMNAANILKPALSRGDIQVIGATTFTEYRKHIEKDSALERRFQPVTVEEPSIEDSIAIASGVAHYYEAYHSVVIPQAMARQAVLLSERYITDRYLPDKAIDLIDEAAADLNLNMVLDYFRTSMFGAFTYINVDGYAMGFERTPGELAKVERMAKLNPFINKAQQLVGYPYIRETPFGTSWISEKGGALFFYDSVKELKVDLPKGWRIEGVKGNVLRDVKPDTVVFLTATGK